MGENIAKANVFENYENKESYFEKHTKNGALIQDEATLITPNYVIKSLIDQEVKLSCLYCNFQSP